MLQSIFIQNYALIDKLDIAFEPGFSVITGETGAGKSIILGAIGIVAGIVLTILSLVIGTSAGVLSGIADAVNSSSSYSYYY